MIINSNKYYIEWYLFSCLNISFSKLRVPMPTPWLPGYHKTEPFNHCIKKICSYFRFLLVCYRKIHAHTVFEILCKALKSRHYSLQMKRKSARVKSAGYFQGKGFCNIQVQCNTKLTDHKLMLLFVRNTAQLLQINDNNYSILVNDWLHNTS